MEIDSRKLVEEAVLGLGDFESELVFDVEFEVQANNGNPAVAAAGQIQMIRKAKWEPHKDFADLRSLDCRTLADLDSEES